MTKSISAALLAASIVFGVSAGSLAQNAPSAGGAGTTGAGAGAKAPSDATGSGKDTGMQVPSGMSGNSPGGVGTAASPTATNPATSSTAGTSSAGGASSGTGKSGASKSKKTAQHSKKHTGSSASSTSR